MLMKRRKSTIPVDEDWETGDEIDWRHYWSIINRRKWSIIGLALAVGLLTTLVVFAMTPIYRASATLLIESQAANVVSIQEVYGLDTRNQDYLATQIEIMGGRPRSAYIWMATRVERRRKALQASEASLQPYREQEQIIDASGLKALPAAEVSNLSARLLEVRQTLAAAKIAYLQVTPVDGQAENLLGVPALLADEGMRRAQAAQATAQQAVAELEK